MISSFNEIPYWPAYVISAAGSLLLSIVLVDKFDMGIMGLVIAPLIINALYNYWKWPVYLMKKVGIHYNEIYSIGYKNIKSKLSKKGDN